MEIAVSSFSNADGDSNNDNNNDGLFMTPGDHSTKHYQANLKPN